MMPLVVRVEDAETGASSQYAFIRSPVRIGRSEINDLPLAQGFVSTWHAVVQFDDQQAQYVDLGSTNGSMVGGARLAKNAPHLLEPGAEVRIGTLRLTFARRATGERQAVPAQATMFAMRAADLNLTAPGVPAMPSGTRSGAAATPPAARVTGAGTPRSTAAGMPAAPTGRATAAGMPAPPAARVTGAGLPAAGAPPILDLPPDLLSGGAPQPLDLPPLDFPDPAVEQALTDAALDLDLLYASYRGSWEHLRGRLAELLQGLEGPARAAASRRLAEKYDALAAERQYQELAGLPAPAAGAAPPAAGSAPAAAPPAGSSDVERLLQTFAESYLPASASVAGREPAQRLLDRVAEALETFCRSYVEMRKGYEEFGKEMGVRTVQGDGPIQRARDHRALMAYLLDPAHQGRGRDLQSAFADLMVHQVALLNGVVEGAKALLARLGPEAISAENPGGMWPMKAQTLWKAFEARHQELVEEEAAISDLLFGREFARAYTAMVGGRSGEEDEDGGGRKRRRR